MEYAVRILPAAKRDAREHYRYILRNSNDAGPVDTWFNGLTSAIRELTKLPASRPRIPEHRDFREPFYQELYHSHRIIFRVTGNVIEILRVYPAWSRPLISLQQRPTLKKSQ